MRYSREINADRVVCSLRCLTKTCNSLGNPRSCLRFPNSSLHSSTPDSFLLFLYSSYTHLGFFFVRIFVDSGDFLSILRCHIFASPSFDCRTSLSRALLAAPIFFVRPAPTLLLLFHLLIFLVTRYSLFPGEPVISSYILYPYPPLFDSDSGSLTIIHTDSDSLVSLYTLLDRACSTGLAQVLIILFVLFWLFVSNANEVFSGLKERGDFLDRKSGNGSWYVDHSPQRTRRNYFKKKGEARVIRHLFGRDLHSRAHIRCILGRLIRSVLDRGGR